MRAPFIDCTHGRAGDEWPAPCERALAADILVLAGPIWLGVLPRGVRIPIICRDTAGQAGGRSMSGVS